MQTRSTADQRPPDRTSAPVPAPLHGAATVPRCVDTCLLHASLLKLTYYKRRRRMQKRDKPGKRRKSRTLVVKEGNKRAATFLTEESSMKPPQVPNFWPHRKPAQSHPLNTAANMSAGGQKEKGPSRQHRLADTGKIKTVQSLLLSPAFQALPSLPASSPSTRCPPPNTRPGSTI